MKNKMICVLLAMAITLVFSVPAFAMDKRVTASNVHVYDKCISKSEAKEHKYWIKGYYTAYAKGYVTSKTKHYANARLLSFGAKVKDSGRKWGTGKVYANTGWDYSGCSIVPDYFGSQIFYGF